MLRFLGLIALLGCSGPAKPLTSCNAGTFTIVDATIAKLQAAIRAHEVTCRQVVQLHLDRIATLDKPRQLNAITVVNPAALTRADAIDHALAAGEALGTLFCAPILVKDNYNTKGMPTTAGSAALATNVSTTNAFMVTKLEEAGAIVVAKTNMAEWAFFPWGTHSGSYGTTANAYAPTHSPAGSSGGTASGVAVSFGVAGLGSDTGNSIRGPSSHLALFGLRSTLGLASRSGVIPLFSDRDVTGPMTRTVEDGVRLFDVISVYDPTDPLAAHGRTHHAASYTAFLDPNALAGKRIGVVRTLVPEDTHAEIKRLFSLALTDLAAKGAVIVDPFAIDSLDAHMKEDNVCPSFRYDVNRYLAAEGAAAPFTDVASVFTSGLFSPDVKEALEELVGSPDVAPDQLPTPCLTYPNNPRRRAFLDDVVASMDRAKIDVLVYPTWTQLPAPLAQVQQRYGGDNSQVIAPETGMPAATVPMGFSEGLYPAGLQILGRPFAEGTVIGVAYAYEQATHHRKPPPLFAPSCK